MPPRSRGNLRPATARTPSGACSPAPRPPSPRTPCYEPAGPTLRLHRSTHIRRLRQLSNAFVRAVEEGARARIARRNVDELLTTQMRLLRLMIEHGRSAEASRVFDGLLRTN